MFGWEAWVWERGQSKALPHLISGPVEQGLIFGLEVRGFLVIVIQAGSPILPGQGAVSLKMQNHKLPVSSRMSRPGLFAAHFAQLMDCSRDGQTASEDFDSLLVFALNDKQVDLAQVLMAEFAGLFRSGHKITLGGSGGGC